VSLIADVELLFFSQAFFCVRVLPGNFADICMGRYCCRSSSSLSLQCTGSLFFIFRFVDLLAYCTSLKSYI
jgi:hypothetical protein